MDPFIVAEVSKSYVNGEPVSNTPPIATLFERIINTNWQRGYKLLSFQLNRIHVDRHVPSNDPAFPNAELRHEVLEETIIAVFVQISDL